MKKEKKVYFTDIEFLFFFYSSLIFCGQENRMLCTIYLIGQPKDMHGWLY